MLKLAVIGKYADILPFRAVGAELLRVGEDDRPEALLLKLKHTGEPYLVMMTEDLTASCVDEIASFRENPLNIFLSIPSTASVPGKRMDEIRALVARSLGVDLLGQKLTQQGEQV